MNQKQTHLKSLTATLTAHSDEEGRLLLASIKAVDAPFNPHRKPMQIAIVIDRSGSMGGLKLDIAKAATAKFIRSLGPEDRVSIITYDTRIDLMCGLVPPSEHLARQIESVEAGGSTDLYGGWVTGARIVGAGGRVILLSDGQANAGRFTDAFSLSRHAELSYQKFGVTTSTIGVGQDYDEAVMAGMARTGAGTHYFAHTAHAIIDAFSQERFSAEALLIRQVSLRCGGKTEQLGHFWGGETKSAVFRINELADLQASIRYTDRETGLTHTDQLSVPTEFGYSEDVLLAFLLHQASEAEANMLNVRSPKSAAEMRVELRRIVLALLAHPASDEQSVKGVVERLTASISRLELLETNYVEENAVMHRKRSMQSSQNLREPAKAFSSFADDVDQVRYDARLSSPMSIAEDMIIDADALSRAPVASWVTWQGLPIAIREGVIVVAFEDPRRGFVNQEIEQATGLRVQPVFAGISSSEIVNRLLAH